MVWRLHSSPSTARPLLPPTASQLTLFDYNGRIMESALTLSPLRLQRMNQPQPLPPSLRLRIGNIFIINRCILFSVSSFASLLFFKYSILIIMDFHFDYKMLN